MIIYADILVALNVLTDYFLLRSSGAIRKIPYRRGRILLASLLGGISSLMIFLPVGKAVSYAAGLICGGMMCGTAFGWSGGRQFLRNMLCLLGMAFAYSAGMYGVWFFAAPAGMYWHNGYVYFDISPVQFVVMVLAIYALLTLVQRWNTLRHRQEGQIIRLRMADTGGVLEGRALVDSGNLLKEPLSGDPVIVADRDRIAAIQPVLGYDGVSPPAEAAESLVRAHFRVVHFQTMHSGGCLTACRVCEISSPDTALQPAQNLYVAACPNLKQQTGYDFIVPEAAVRADLFHETTERGNFFERKNTNASSPMDGMADPDAEQYPIHQRRRHLAGTADCRGGSRGDAAHPGRG